MKYKMKSLEGFGESNAGIVRGSGYYVMKILLVMAVIVGLNALYIFVKYGVAYRGPK